MSAILHRIRQNPQQFIPFIFLIAVLLYLYGARQQFLYVNTDMSRTDQAAYLNTARLMKSSNYTAFTDRNRMPIYPFLLSLLYEEELSDEAFFARGKLLNIGLSLLILPILFWIFRKYLPLFTAVNLLLIHAFTIYIFKAAYTQAELLFYLLNFLTFLLMCRLLWRPSWKMAILTGILLGLAHLTKASVLPGLILFLATAVFQALAKGWQAKSDGGNYRQFSHYLATPALVVLLFLATIWPYIQNSKEQFGHYFYNVNSTFYIWYDHWDEVEAGTKAHGDRVGWPDMPAEELPSAAKYFREHTLADVRERLSTGFLIILIAALASYGYLKYVIIFFSFVFALFILNRHYVVTTILKKHLYLSLFVASFFAAYLTLYAWYWPISSGNRFVLALFTPFMFTLAFIIYRLFETKLIIPLSRNSSRTINLGRVLNWAMLGVLFVDGTIILVYRIANTYGGY